ncbi:HNH endonuclease family protein [Microbacterium betulae]|uniref:HNH endonuclease family protein n=1 Tax=Microbacterium betulae TaxID=2981139 RepID=A0AA97FG07_9MICO|nr:HNH endonuclease family protein [Microbacterium sp. AB]WOF22508.1 HNH endonuclease family protein [Microbacterium sp. AB]
MTSPRAPFVRVALTAVLVPALLVGAHPDAASAASTVNASTLLNTLPVKAENTSKYDRSLFNYGIDADKDGCNTRAEVLMAESKKNVTHAKSSCTVKTGRWHSQYDGRTYTDASKLEIDHLVALSEAWDSGAQKWSASRRQKFANDLGYAWTLNAVSTASNQAKVDKDPAQWLPAKNRCQYVAEWVAVKYRWSLAIDAAEKTAIQKAMKGCTAASLTVTAPKKA